MAKKPKEKKEIAPPPLPPSLSPGLQQLVSIPPKWQIAWRTLGAAEEAVEGARIAVKHAKDYLASFHNTILNLIKEEQMLQKAGIEKDRTE